MKPLIISIIISLLILWAIGASISFTDFCKWKIVAKNFDKIEFYRKTEDSSIYYFNLYSKNREIAIAEIKLENDRNIVLIDHISGEIHLKPRAYFLFCYRFIKSLTNLLPPKEQAYFGKRIQPKSFEDYL